MQLALITGASMGIGEEFAVQLAAKRTNLILVARSADKLEALADQLRQSHGVEVTVFACDLSVEGAAARVIAFLEEKGLHPTMLINNAGFGMVGRLEELDPARVRAMMNLNIATLVELTQGLLPTIRLSRQGRIINVASTAAFQPVPFFGVYAASKAFVLSFTEALAEELRGSDVRVTALCPGPTPTNFHVDANIDPSWMDQGQTVREVVAMGLAGNERGRVVIVCQRKWAVWVLRLVPRVGVRRIAGIVARRLLAKQLAAN